jgi:hypothetical protein
VLVLSLDPGGDRRERRLARSTKQPDRAAVRDRDDRAHHGALRHRLTVLAPRAEADGELREKCVQGSLSDLE